MAESHVQLGLEARDRLQGALAKRLSEYFCEWVLIRRTWSWEFKGCTYNTNEGRTSVDVSTRELTGNANLCSVLGLLTYSAHILNQMWEDFRRRTLMTKAGCRVGKLSRGATKSSEAIVDKDIEWTKLEISNAQD